MHDALTALRGCLADVQYPLETGEAVDSRRARREALAQLDDYILPRVRRLDAPLLVVVGGSTGAGKSTLVNALVGRVVTETGVLRPTTRSPVLIHHPDDVDWFHELRILPDLPRVDVSDRAGGGLRLVADTGLPAGVAILDAPDIDSVVTENRALAAQLLAAADLWLFVTTAARYSDAVPWDFLHEAAARHAAVAVVLDRVPPGAASEVRGHLSVMLAKHELSDAPLLVVEEITPEESGLLPESATTAVRDWLRGLAADDKARGEVVRRTFDGTVESLLRRTSDLADAADRQVDAAMALHAGVTDIYEATQRHIDESTSDGALLRGEVLARWQDFVGTGDIVRSLEAQASRVRDKVTAFLRGRAQPAVEVGAAIEQGLAAMIVEGANQAAERADHRWRENPAGRVLLESEDLSRASADFSERCSATVRAWQEATYELVRAEGAQRRFNARLLSVGINGLGLSLMVALFVSTTGLTGAEIGVAGGTPVVGRKLLEAVFGADAVGRLAATARADLSERVETLLATESARFTDRLGKLPIDSGAGDRLRTALVSVEQAQEHAA